MAVDAILRDSMRRLIWCSPMQDFQYVFKPVRVTPPRGVSGYFNYPTVIRKTIPLPTTDRRDLYIVYQLGSIFNNFVDLPDVRNVWLNASGITGFNNLMIDVYTEQGISYPRFLIWCYMTDSNNVLLAVKREPAVDVFHKEDLYMRLYSNAYYRSDQTIAGDGMECFGGIVTTPSSAAVLQQRYLNSLTRNGNTLVWINGVLSSNVDQSTLKSGDCVDVVWDSSIYKVVDFRVSELESFYSELDLKQKYLLHPSKTLSESGIEYYDDIDFYICNVKPNETKGVYYYKHGGSAVRMLTHRDYAIPVQALDYITSTHDHWNNSSEATIRMFYRKSPYIRPLEYESSRIANLYELPDSEIKAAMVGIDSLVPEWKASSLEMSPYVEAMRRPDLDMDPQDLQDLYGYHGIANKVANAFHVFDGDSSILVLESLQKVFTAYEYSEDGLLLGRWLGEDLDAYRRQNSQSKYVELVSGKGSQRVYDYYNQTSVVLTDSTCSYRVYQSLLLNGKHIHEWKDITGDDRVTRTGDTITIGGFNPLLEEILVREDTNHLSYEVNVLESDEVLEFTINTQHSENGQIVTAASHLPYLSFTLILNGRTLTRGIEYIVDWPRITITSNRYRNASGVNKVLVRAKGLLSKDTMDIIPYKESGFTNFGYLSRNGVYNIREGYSLKYVVDGRVRSKDDLHFGDVENEPVVSGYPDSVPYFIQEYVQSVRGLVGKDIFDLYLESVEFTKRVEDYLTLRLPEPVMELADNLFDTGNPTAFSIMPSNTGMVNVSPYVRKYVPPADQSMVQTWRAPGDVTDPLLRFSVGLSGQGVVTIVTSELTRVVTLTAEFQRVDLTATSGQVTLTLAYSLGCHVSTRGVMFNITPTAKPYNVGGERVYFDRFKTSSPMMTKVYADLRSGVIPSDQVNAVRSDSQVLALLKDVEYLAAYDPSRQNMDPRFSEHLAFPIVAVRQARQAEILFLERVSRLYFKSIYAPAKELTLETGV